MALQIRMTEISIIVFYLLQTLHTDNFVGVCSSVQSTSFPHISPMADLIKRVKRYSSVDSVELIFQFISPGTSGELHQPLTLTLTLTLTLYPSELKDKY